MSTSRSPSPSNPQAPPSPLNPQAPPSPSNPQAPPSPSNPQAPPSPSTSQAPPSPSTSQAPPSPSTSRALVLFNCKVCSLMDITTCNGCIFSRYFVRDEDFDHFPALLSQFGFYSLRDKLEYIELKFGYEVVKFHIEEMMSCIRISNDHFMNVTKQLTDNFAGSILNLENMLRVKDHEIKRLRSVIAAPGSSAPVRGSPSLAVDPSLRWVGHGPRSVRTPRKHDYVEEEEAGR